MRIRSALAGWASLLAVLGFQTAAEACYYQAPSVGWSPIARLPRSLAEADELNGNSVRMPVSWHGRQDVGPLAGRPVRLHFRLRDCKLYAFQFTPAAGQR